MSRPNRSDGSASDPGERRGHPRLPVEGISGGFLFSTNARILNLSLDGMALETSDYLQVGRAYALKLTQDNDELSLRGRVVWCRMVGTKRLDNGETTALYSAGLQFENLLSGTAREVHRFLGANAVIAVEKRLFGRFRLHDQRTADLDHEASFRVETISLSGMEIDSDTFVDPETAVDLELRVGDQVVTTRGRVVHGRRLPPQPGVESAARLGIEFTHMTEDAEQAIKQLIRSAIR